MLNGLSRIWDLGDLEIRFQDPGRSETKWDEVRRKCKSNVRLESNASMLLFLWLYNYSDFLEENFALHRLSSALPCGDPPTKTSVTMSTEPLRIKIRYWGSWGCKRFFVSLKEALEKEFQGKVAIVAIPDTSSTGNFEVTLVKTGQLVHSKRNGGGKCDVGSEERAALFSLIRSMVA